MDMAAPRQSWEGKLIILSCFYKLSIISIGSGVADFSPKVNIVLSSDVSKVWKVEAGKRSALCTMALLQQFIFLKQTPVNRAWVGWWLAVHLHVAILGRNGPVLYLNALQ